MKYYSFGMGMPGRNYNARSYRYGFNGKEDDKDITEGSQDYGMRIYDRRLGRFLSVDPLTREYPWYTPYQFAGNKPIEFIDRDGEEEHDPMLHDDLAYLSGKMSSEKLRENQTARGMGVLIAGAIMADIYLFKGKATQTLFVYAPVLGAFEHNVAKTDEGKRAQVARAKENLSTGLANYGLGVVLGKIYKFGSQFFSEVKVSTRQFLLNTKCFVAGTKILTKAGFKNIEDVAVGDSVWAYNEQIFRSELAVVKETLTSKASKLVKLELDSVIIWATSEHPFFIRNKWVASNQISVGDSLTLFGNKRKAVSNYIARDTLVVVYSFTVGKFHNYYISSYGVLVHNDCSFSWQNNKAMNDVLAKSIHGDVFNSKGLKVGEVGFELENGVITPKALGRNLSTETTSYIEKVGNKQLQTDGFKTELLDKVNEALNSGQIKAGSNRITKLQTMQKILTPSAK